MGYNPQRRMVRKPGDVLFVAAAVVVALALVVWALFG
jgi:hypothetical protein